MSLLNIKDKYCIEICKGKCCFTEAGNKCPNLKADNTCQIHKLWRDNWCNYQTEEIKTMPIMQAIERRLIKQDVIDQCCYAHPELLEKLNGE